MNEDNVDDCRLMCFECEHNMSSDDDLLPYEDRYVCEECFDNLRRADEQEYQEWETEGYDYE